MKVKSAKQLFSVVEREKHTCEDSGENNFFDSVKGQNTCKYE